MTEAEPLNPRLITRIFDSQQRHIRALRACLLDLACSLHEPEHVRRQIANTIITELRRADDSLAEVGGSDQGGDDSGVD